MKQQIESNNISLPSKTPNQLASIQRGSNTITWKKPAKNTTGKGEETLSFKGTNNTHLPMTKKKAEKEDVTILTKNNKGQPTAPQPKTSPK